MASPWAQRAILKLLLSLPTPILRLLSGGGVVYREGRTLDPRYQFLAAMNRSAPPVTRLAPEEARRVTAQGLLAVAGRIERGVETETLALPGPRGDLPARAYRPPRQDTDMPLLVYAHFGGGVVGDLETSDAFCSILAATVRGPVLSVDYGLAPEHRFPAGLDDLAFAYRWGRDNADRFGAPVGRAMIGGDSMGGNFAAVIAQDLKRAGEPQPALQLLIYPCVDVASETASMSLHAEAYPLSRTLMDWFIGHYVGPDADPADPRLSPMRTTDLGGLAPAVVITAGFDPLVDQGEAYAQALRAAGVETIYRRYDSLAHGFTAFTGAVPAADDAAREIARLVREALVRPAREGASA
jgi:acetyl esterase/lipase